jgi:hypothetical protein
VEEFDGRNAPSDGGVGEGEHLLIQESRYSVRGCWEEGFTVCGAPSCEGFKVAAVATQGDVGIGSHAASKGGVEMREVHFRNGQGVFIEGLHMIQNRS